MHARGDDRLLPARPKLAEHGLVDVLPFPSTGCWVAHVPVVGVPLAGSAMTTAGRGKERRCGHDGFRRIEINVYQRSGRIPKQETNVFTTRREVLREVLYGEAELLPLRASGCLLSAGDRDRPPTMR